MDALLSIIPSRTFNQNSIPIKTFSKQNIIVLISQRSHLFAFAWNAKRFAIACVLLLLLAFLQGVSGALELQIGTPDFKNFAIWPIEAVSSAFSKVSKDELI